jgi:hypothetical protein
MPRSATFLTSSVWAHFFYRGAVVYTEVLVGVDGFRVYLPMPDPKLMTVPKGALDMAGLLWEIGPSNWPFDECVKQAGLITVARPWPRGRRTERALFPAWSPRQHHQRRAVDLERF